MTIDPKALSALCLVACDQSYAINGTTDPASLIGTQLASFPDSANGEDYVPPMSLFEDAGIPYAICGGIAVLNGWTIVSAREDRSTGFGFLIYQNSTKTDAMVVFTGSNGLNEQDWYSNINLGATQWRSDNRLLVQREISLLENANGGKFSGSINFAGQSLGGGLAQYALYDFERYKTDIGMGNNALTLTTFNAFGAADGIKDIYKVESIPAYSHVATKHYVVANDLVNRLGGGHLNGGPANTYFLDLFRTIAQPFYDEFGNEIGELNPHKAYYDCAEAHRIESGFYRYFEETTGGFSKLNPGYAIDYIGENAVRSLGAESPRLL